MLFRLTKNAKLIKNAAEIGYNQFECPHCGAKYILSLEEGGKRNSCGRKARTLSERVRFVLTAINEQEISVDILASILDVSLSAVYCAMNETYKRQIKWADRCANLGVDLNYIYGFSCEPWKIDFNVCIELLKQYPVSKKIICQKGKIAKRAGEWNAVNSKKVWIAQHDYVLESAEDLY